jgi:hypothetical protein
MKNTKEEQIGGPMAVDVLTSVGAPISTISREDSASITRTQRAGGIANEINKLPVATCGKKIIPV